MTDNDRLDVKELGSLFDADFVAGTLTWKPRPENWFPCPRVAKSWNSRYAGKPAITALSNGYKHGQAKGVKLMAHRVLWAMRTGAWPMEEIDHINGDRSDNRQENLREISSAENKKNAGIGRDNQSGVIGVSWSKKCKKWHAKIGVDGRYIFLGGFDLFSDAVEARGKAERQHGFHENHGRSAVK